MAGAYGEHRGNVRRCDRDGGLACRSVRRDAEVFKRQEKVKSYNSVKNDKKDIHEGKKSVKNYKKVEKTPRKDLTQKVEVVIITE